MAILFGCLVLRFDGEYYNTSVETSIVTKHCGKIIIKPQEKTKIVSKYVDRISQVFLSK